MHSYRRSLLSLSGILFGVVTTVTAQAATVSQPYSGGFPGSVSGTLPDQGSALQVPVTLPSAGNFVATTTSYALGGFQPSLLLFSASGITVATQSATPPSGAAADPTTGVALDGTLTATGLTAGSYTLTVTDWLLGQAPTATNLSSGFTFNLGNGSTFVDVNGATRTGTYTLGLAFTGNATSPVPEPSAFSLTILPLAAAAAIYRKRRTANVHQLPRA